MARPTLYKEEFAEQARKFSLLGATDEEMAGFFGVAVSTFYKWKKAQPMLVEAIKKGKEKADADVAKSLYNRALGYSHKDEDIRVIDGQVVRIEIIKHYPPDTASAIFWLKNRQPKIWREKQEIDHKVFQEQPLFDADENDNE